LELSGNKILGWSVPGGTLQPSILFPDSSNTWVLTNVAAGKVPSTGMMTSQQLCNSLARFSKSGKLEDLRSVFPSSVPSEDPSIRVDVSLQLALRVSERCVAIQKITHEPMAWYCLSIFLHERTYPRAEEFANSFLLSSAARKSFQYTRQSIEGTTNTGTAEPLLVSVYQFLAHALLHDTLLTYVFKMGNDTYRAAFELISKTRAQQSSPLRRPTITLLRSILLCRAESTAEDKFILNSLFVMAGGPSALTATFWMTCDCINTATDPEEVKVAIDCCVNLVVRVMGVPHPVPVEKLLCEWCETEATSRQGIIAGYYAMFEASEQAPTPALRSTLSGQCVSAACLTQLFRERCSKQSLEQAMKFPYEGDTFPLEGTWLYKCLQATCRYRRPYMMNSAVYWVSSFVDDIPWAVEVIQLIVSEAAEKQVSRPESACAFPGCEVSGTALCPLRKCSRCLAVFYCTPAHQREHWPTHKPSCIRPPPAEPAGTADATPAGSVAAVNDATAVDSVGSKKHQLGSGICDDCVVHSE
jgi:hypothetical protein